MHFKDVLRTIYNVSKRYETLPTIFFPPEIVWEQRTVLYLMNILQTMFDVIGIAKLI